jgi:putrescine transport system permease protein
MVLAKAATALGPVRRKFAPWNDPASKPFIEFRNVTKRFDDFTAVDNVTLSIYEREFFALLGPSGCGKTTMMRMVAGFEEPTAGDVLLDGRSLAGVPPYRRPTNMMFQSYALFPHMTVEANIAFGLKQAGMPAPDIKQRVEEMLTLVKLTGFARRKPDQLSGGQRQRVALARSLAKKPKVLLLDEPLAALDKKLREETQFELIDLQVTLGLTFLIVTHDQEEAMTVADRIAVMNHGKVVQVATPAEIYEQPNSRYVADFVGDINLLEGRHHRRRRPRPDGCDGTGAIVEVDRRSGVSGDAVVRHPPGEGIDLPRPPGRSRRQRHCRRGVGHRLSRRCVDLSRAAGDRRHGQGDGHQPYAAGRAADHLGRQGVADLGPRLRRGADAMNGDAPKHRSWRWGVIALPYAWLAALFLVPFLIVFKISFSTVAVGVPPYAPNFDLAHGIGGLIDAFRQFTVDNYTWLTQDDLYARAYLGSLWIAGVSTLLVLLIGYPIAYGMARAPRRWQPILLMLVILPFWTSFLIRVYAWIGILKKEGLLNQLLLWLGVIHEPLTILNTNWAVYIGIVYSYLPFMVLPLYAALEKMDESLLEAAADLGCPPLKAFWKITFPLSLPGVIAGCFLVFIPATGEFVIPDLLGGSDTLMIGKTLWSEFFSNRDWPIASAVAVILLLILVVPIVIFQNRARRPAAAISARSPEP